jgi:translation elongation factor EF-G
VKKSQVELITVKCTKSKQVDVVNLRISWLNYTTVEDPEKTGLEFVNSIKGGNIPREFVPSVEKGFKDAMKNGVLAGFPIDSLKVELKDGSSTLSIQIHCLSRCVRKWPIVMRCQKHALCFLSQS